MLRRGCLLFRKKVREVHPNHEWPTPPTSVLHAHDANDDNQPQPLVPPRLMQDPSFEVQIRLGKELADKARYLSDSQWEQVPLKEKHYFTKVIAERLRESPAEVSEQQRRRYFETTTQNVRFEPEQITNPYQRMKVGLPFEFDTKGRNITVSEAMMERGDEAEFDPHNATNIEYAQMHFKQAFKDYVANRKAGRSTETERRKIAAMAESLQHEVQKHLANMYKHADTKLHDAVKAQALARLQTLARVRAKAERTIQGDDESQDPPDGEPQELQGMDDNTTAAPSEGALPQVNREPAPGDLDQTKPQTSRIERTAKRYGLDVKLAETMWQSFQTQESFFEKLEVLHRLTSGRGFAHTPKDESLTQYADNLSQLLSLDPSKAASLDVVKYYAQLELCEPTDWARRWYEKTLLYPLEAIPEYQKLLEVSTTADSAALRSAATERVDKVRSFSAMVVAGGGPSVSLQHQRVRHLAHSYMQTQIRRMRAKCLKYEGIDLSEESNKVQSLCQRMRARGNDFKDPEVMALHKEVMDAVEEVVAKHGRTGSEDSPLRVAQAVASGDRARIETELNRLKRKKKAEQVLRMVRVLEEDVRADIEWQEAFENAERPPLLPEPEPFLYVSASDALALRAVRDRDAAVKGNPFLKSEWSVNLLGRKIDLPTKPLLFWGTGTAAVEQALALAVEEAQERRRQGDGESPHGGDEERNPWGWRRQTDILD